MDLSFSIPVIGKVSGTIVPNQPVKCELMQDISKLRLYTLSVNELAFIGTGSHSIFVGSL